MKYLFIFFLTLFLFSCIEPSTHSVHKISNPLNYDILIKTYSNNRLSDSILILSNTSFEKNYYKEVPIEPFFNINDSILYVFDGMKSTRYVNNRINVNNRSISNSSNWKTESITISKRKKSSKKIYEYTFIEQDYLDAR